MPTYQSKERRLTGSSYNELERKARKIYQQISARTKRSPYVRSLYFYKSKIFLQPFWTHLHQKSQHDRRRRLLYYAAAIDLIRHSKITPTTKQDMHGDLLHRFSGMTKDGEQFYVQIKEDISSDRKYFMSVFPPN